MYREEVCICYTHTEYYIHMYMYISILRNLKFRTILKEFYKLSHRMHFLILKFIPLHSYLKIFQHFSSKSIISNLRVIIGWFFYRNPYN